MAFFQPPDLPFVFLRIWKSRKSVLIFFVCFSKLIAFPVSAVASGWFFAVGSAILWLKSCPERAGEANTDVQKKQKFFFFSKKACLSTWCGPHNSQTYPLVVYFWFNLLMTVAYFAIRWQSWQTGFKTKSWQTYPPQPWGASSVLYRLRLRLRLWFRCRLRAQWIF